MSTSPSSAAPPPSTPLPQPAVDAARLAALTPTRALPEAARADLARRAEVRCLEAGAVLHAAKERGRLLYLLEGTLALAAPEQAPVKLRAGTERAGLPLFSKQFPYSAAKSLAPARVLVLDAAAVRDALAGARTAEAGPGAADAARTRAVGLALDEITAAYEQGSLDLPAMPEVAVRIGERMRNPDVSIDALAELAQLDPAVAGYLIQVANSALYAGRGRARNVVEAVSRLGLKTTQSLVTAIALRNMFEVEDADLRARARENWGRSVDVGAAAHAVVQCTDEDLDAERALLAGLLHRVGAVPVLDHFAARQVTPDAAVVEAALEKLTTRVGMLVVDAWQLGRDLSEVVEHWADPERPTSGRADYCDAVQVAVALLDGGDEAVAALPARARLGLPDEGLAALREHAETAVSVFRGLLGR
jgi:HD-like signal output (HDOD) protein